MRLRCVVTTVVIATVICLVPALGAAKKPTKHAVPKPKAQTSPARGIPTWQKWGRLTVGIMFCEFDLNVRGNFSYSECNGVAWLTCAAGEEVELCKGNNGYRFVVSNESEEPLPAQGAIFYKSSLPGVEIKISGTGGLAFPPEGLIFNQRLLPGDAVTAFEVPAAAAATKTSEQPSSATTIVQTGWTPCRDYSVHIPKGTKPGTVTLQFGVKEASGRNVVMFPLVVKIDVRDKT